MYNTTDVPCRNCEDRKLGCHSSCEKYKAFKDRIESKNKNRQSFYNAHPKKVWKTTFSR